MKCDACSELALTTFARNVIIVRARACVRACVCVYVLCACVYFVGRPRAALYKIMLGQYENMTEKYWTISSRSCCRLAVPITVHRIHVGDSCVSIQKLVRDWQSCMCTNGAMISIDSLSLSLCLFVCLHLPVHCIISLQLSHVVIELAIDRPIGVRLIRNVHFNSVSTDLIVHYITLLDCDSSVS